MEEAPAVPDCRRAEHGDDGLPDVTGQGSYEFRRSHSWSGERYQTRRILEGKRNQPGMTLRCGKDILSQPPALFGATGG